MINYFYDPVTKEYSHQEAATVDVLETQYAGVVIYFTLPNSTQKIQLAISVGFAIVFDLLVLVDNPAGTNEWIYVEDHRGDIYYLPADETEYIMYDIGPMPADAQDDMDLDLRQDIAWEIAKDYETEKGVEHILYNTDEYQIDVLDWVNITDAILRFTLATPPANRVWTVVDDSQVTLVEADFQAIAVLKIDRDESLHAAGQLTRTDIYASANPELMDIPAVFDGHIV